MLVSIIIPVHQTAPFFKTCVASALSQTHQDIEVIIACNGDLEIHQCEDFLKVNDSRLVFIKTKRGRNHARNEALLIAKGDFIQFLDYDDLLFPDKLATQLSLIGNNGNTSICITKWKKFTQNIDENYVFPFKILFKETNITAAQLIQKLGESGGFIATASWIVSRDLLSGIQWIDSPNDDAVFFSEICKKNPNIIMVSQVLAGCRIHENNTSAIRSREQLDLLLKSWKQIHKNLKTIENSGVNLYLYKSYLYLIRYSKAIKKYRMGAVVYKSIIYGVKGGAGFSVFMDLKKVLFK